MTLKRDQLQNKQFKFKFQKKSKESGGNAKRKQVQVSETETARKVEALIRKQDGLWNFLVCDFKSSKNCHLKEHVETLCFKHI